ncbi:MAG: InlB B-repeat-containing protein, partial [Treponema sp.]|nr:InlB B-repeat-containing protein [Treponema sp.]
MEVSRKVTKGITTSMRHGLLAFAAFALIGFGIASCGDTPGGGDPGDPNNKNNGNTTGTTTYAITFNDSHGSTAQPSPAKQGDKVQLSIGARIGYGFSGWTVKPASVEIADDNTFTMPAGAVEITAMWELGAYDIIVNQGGGSGSKVNNSKYSEQPGETVTLKTGTYDGYTFDSWIVVKPVGLEINLDNTFTMPDEVV